MFRVLLVCTGNICRTPLAKGFLTDRSRRLLGATLRVRSAGTWARLGNPPTREAVEVAGERDIDIATHMATPFSADLAEWADLILTMTTEHVDEVLEEAPEASHRTFTLKEFVALLAELPPPAETASRWTMEDLVKDADRLRTGPDSPWIADLDVSDPLGLDIETYRVVAWEIEGLIDSMVRLLAGERVSAGED